MTKKEVKDKFKRMVKENDRVMILKMESFLKSGALDLSEYEDDYQLPKILMYATLLEAVPHYKPLDSISLETAKNLSHF